MKLDPGNLVITRYFTSIVLNNDRDPSVAERQAVYLRALRTLPETYIHKGQFRLRDVVGEKVDPKTGKSTGEMTKIRKFSEKGSDVNLATYMVRDAAMAVFDVAVVISNDSDLGAAFRIVKKDFKEAVILVSPGQKPSNYLSGYAKKTHKLTLAEVRDSQFPENLQDKNGRFSRPFTWGPDYRGGNG